jgi:hypothetical protein
VRAVSDPESEHPAAGPADPSPAAERPESAPADGAAEPETAEEKRARVMRRLAEIIRADPPDLSGSEPVSAGGFPALPGSADEFDQEAAAELFAALQGFFEQRRPGRSEESSQDLEKE